MPAILNVLAPANVDQVPIFRGNNFGIRYHIELLARSLHFPKFAGDFAPNLCMQILMFSSCFSHILNLWRCGHPE